MNQWKSWFFKRTDKIDKIFWQIQKKRIQMNTIRDEKYNRHWENLEKSQWHALKNYIPQNLEISKKWANF